MSVDDREAKKFLVATVEAGWMQTRGSTPEVAINQPEYLYTAEIVHTVTQQVRLLRHGVDDNKAKRGYATKKRIGLKTLRKISHLSDPRGR